MQTSPSSRRRRFILAGLVIVYVVGFLAARVSHVLVHRVSFATESQGRVYFHRVVAGDFGPGLLQSGVTRFGVSVSHFLFTPLRWAESLVWRFIPREYVFTNHAA
jgi:hypothetical protein